MFVKNSIAIASDHNGVQLKEKLKTHLKKAGHTVVDVGPYVGDVSVDYVDYASVIGTIISNKELDRGILICGTGVGMAVSANKINGVRAALVHNELTAEKSREHNDANIIALGAWITNDNNNISFVNKWLGTDYGEYRHVKRVEKIDPPNKDNLVLTNGCFDIIHTGHIKLLEWSKSLGNKLIVALNSDKSIKSIKGESRPINSENDRRAILMSMSFVDDCIIFDDTSPTSIIETINPEIVVKGGEWTADEVRSRDKIADHIEIKIFPFYKNYSTTNIIEKIHSDETK